MAYVEWLRVRNCLRTTAIILGILLVVAIALRISVSRYMSVDGWVHHIQTHPGTHVSTVMLPNGVKRMIIDDPQEQTHIIVDDRGYAGKHIVITEPLRNANEHNDHVAVGSIHVFETHSGNLKTTVIDTNGSVPMLYYMAFADVVALLIATMMAAPLAREMDGHLEVALTKPVSRVRFALGSIGADVACILGASPLTILALYICQLLFESPSLDFSGINAKAIAMGVFLPLAWYGMLCAATTWTRSIGAVLGFAWPVAGLISLLTLVQPGNVVALFIHDVAWTLWHLFPFAYVSMAEPDAIGQATYSGEHFTLRLSVEILLFVVYSGLAIVRWQRVEA